MKRLSPLLALASAACMVPPPATQAGSVELGRPAALEALYRHQIVHNASGGQTAVARLCLAIGAADRLADPPVGLVARFAGHRPPVAGVSACRWDGARWVDRATGGAAIVHHVAAFACESATRCHARGGYLEGNLSASVNRYALERRDGRWIVTGDVMEAIA